MKYPHCCVGNVKVSSGGEARKEMHAGPNKRSQSEQVGVLGEYCLFVGLWNCLQL